MFKQESKRGNDVIVHDLLPLLSDTNSLSVRISLQTLETSFSRGTSLGGSSITKGIFSVLAVSSNARCGFVFL